MYDDDDNIFFMNFIAKQKIFHGKIHTKKKIECKLERLIEDWYFVHVSLYVYLTLISPYMYMKMGSLCVVYTQYHPDFNTDNIQSKRKLD